MSDPISAILLRKEHNIASFAAKDTSRFVIESVHYNAEKKFLEATNSLIHILVPVEVSNSYPGGDASPLPEDCIIPRNAFARAMRSIPKTVVEILNSVRLLTRRSERQELKASFSAISSEDETSVIGCRTLEGNYPKIDEVDPF